MRRHLGGGITAAAIRWDICDLFDVGRERDEADEARGGDVAELSSIRGSLGTFAWLDILAQKLCWKKIWKGKDAVSFLTCFKSENYFIIGISNATYT